MSRKTRRDLRPEELELWSKVKQTAEPLHTAKATSQTSTLAMTSTPKSPVAPSGPLFPSKSVTPTPSTSVFRAPDIRDELAGRPVEMDRQAYRKMTRGKLKPEARLDLHGMTLSEAHPELNRFIRQAHSTGKRLVLVITGKGKYRDEGGPIPTRTGVLKHQVPQWLQQSGLQGLVLQVTSASQNYGGSGAYFVYLRRHRK